MGDTAQAIELLACLTRDGSLDDAARGVPAEYWRVRRLQQGQEVWTGHLFHTDRGWQLRRDGGEDEPLLAVATHRLRPGEHLVLHQPDGQELVFRVVNVAPAAEPG